MDAWKDFFGDGLQVQGAETLVNGKVMSVVYGCANTIDL